MNQPPFRAQLLMWPQGQATFPCQALALSLATLHRCPMASSPISTPYRST